MAEIFGDVNNFDDYDDDGFSSRGVLSTEDAQFDEILNHDGPSPVASPLALAVDAEEQQPGPSGHDDNNAQTRSPKKRGKKVEPLTSEEFFGVYCLISRSEKSFYKNRCYVGYTVDPNRRIRQHNAGKQAGGAAKTDSKGPWDMVCIVHGFPNSVSALRFEWAWQHPDKSRRLKVLKLRKNKKESPFDFRLRIVAHMLASDPWCRLALTFRWLIPEEARSLPNGLELPTHMSTAFGLVPSNTNSCTDEKRSTQDAMLSAFDANARCALCHKEIAGALSRLSCLKYEHCPAHFHSICLADHFLKGELSKSADFNNSSGGHGQEHYFIPVGGACPKCRTYQLWGDLIRRQRWFTAALREKG